MTELQKADSRALVPKEYGEHAGVGFENQTQEDIQIPFIALLQGLSPQVDSQEDSYVDGAQPGMFFNTVTTEIYPEGLEFIPCHTERNIVEWVDREQGQGFVAVHDKDSELFRRAVEKAGTKFGKIFHPDNPKHVLVNTVCVFGIIYRDETDFQYAVIPVKSTQHLPYKKWNTRISTSLVPGPDGARIQPPIYANRVLLTAVRQQNDKGKFFNYKFSPAVNNDLEASLLGLEDPRVQAAIALRDLVIAGTAKVDFSTDQNSVVEEEDDGGGVY